MTLIPYKTLLTAGEDEFIVNKSRFIGHGKPCENEDEALDFIAQTRARYRDASHNCYAYVLSPNKGIMRYSDDGEPGGTAGLPMMEVLKARDVTNCCVVVTRYFGGVLLGAGGLVRAYSKSASGAVKASGVGVMHPTARYLADVPYPLLGRLEYRLNDLPVEVADKAFADVITLDFWVRTVDETAVVEAIVRATDGRVEPVRFEEAYRAWPEPTPDGD